VYTLKTVQNGSGLEVSFTGKPADVDGYKLLVEDETNAIVKTNPVPFDSSNKYNLTISGLTVGKTYTLQLFNANDDTNQNLLAKASVEITDGNNASMLNSNLTGYNSLKKQRVGQKMHGFYQNNTNSCASCHQTHTAKDDNLLFKDGVYNTCSACHDGTTSAKNSDSLSGTFNVSDDVAHGSFHQADGSIQITAAPGVGNKTPDTTVGSLGAGTWGQSFDCASCHEPHGGGSSAENNLNPDPLGWGGVAYASKAGVVVGTDGNGNPIKSTTDNKFGKLFKDLVPSATVPTTFNSATDSPYILVKSQIGSLSAIADSTMKYIYTRAGVPDDSWVIQTYRWDGTNYVPDYSLWLRDLGHKNAPFQNANTVLYDASYSGTTAPDSTHDITSQEMNVVWRDGFAFGTGVTKVVSADISIGIDVETTANVQSLYPVLDSNGQIVNKSTYIPDSGVEMTKYCTACHNDYITDPNTGDIGVLTSVSNTHRHPGLTDQMTCVRCHYSHGTKASIMKDKTGNVASAIDTLSDINHSSALRRYIDTDSCYTSGCHSNTQGDSLYLDVSLSN
jgi:predicted CXXCH cytochrome family protein